MKKCVCVCVLGKLFRETGNKMFLTIIFLLPGSDEGERKYDRDPECDEGWYDGGGGGAVPSRVLVGDYSNGAYRGGMKNKYQNRKKTRDVLSVS